PAIWCSRATDSELRGSVSRHVIEGALPTPAAWGSEAVCEVLKLLGRHVWVLNAPGLEGSDAVHKSGDVDCAVEGLDHSWPLRLGDGWRFCQRLQYNALGCYWVLERNGQVQSTSPLLWTAS